MKSALKKQPKAKLLQEKSWTSLPPIGDELLRIIFRVFPVSTKRSITSPFRFVYDFFKKHHKLFGDSHMNKGVKYFFDPHIKHIEYNVIVDLFLKVYYRNK